MCVAVVGENGRGAQWMKTKGARGHSKSETHLQNSRVYERILDQHAFDQQRLEEDMYKDQMERCEYTKPSALAGTTLLPKPAKRSGHHRSAIEQEVWSILASEGADFGFEDDLIGSEQNRLLLEARNLSLFRIQESDSEDRDVNEQEAWETLENDDEVRAELQEIMSKFLFSYICE
jgi:hypothetical protein